MAEHKLKTHPKEFQAIWDGIKLFEIRKNDRDFKVGDWLILEEYLPQENKYTGKSIECSVTYLVASPEWNLPEGMVVMGIKIIGSFNNNLMKFKLKHVPMIEPESIKETNTKKWKLPSSDKVYEISHKISEKIINNRYIIDNGTDSYSKLLKEKLDAGGKLTFQEKCYLPENICDNKECKHPRSCHLDEAHLKGEEKSSDRGWCTKPEGSCIFGSVDCGCLKFIEPNV